MNVPLQVSFHQIPGEEAAERLIRMRVRKLEKLCDHLSSCRVAIEPRRKRDVAAYRVRVTMTVPPAHELVAQSNATDVDLLDLRACIRDAFDAAERQLTTVTEEQRGEVKRHEAQEIDAVVERIFPQEGYGFLLSADGREVYSHANSLLNKKFEELQPGMGVHFQVQTGEKGPQASTVRVIDTRGRRAAARRA